jgi:cryptochrome
MPAQVYQERKQHTKPPVSLLGQLLWREFYYVAAAHTPNYHQMAGNPICKQIPWDNNEEFYRAWDECRTGYPWIDAIMTQLHQTGWMHHLARHCVVGPTPVST